MRILRISGFLVCVTLPIFGCTSAGGEEPGEGICLDDAFCEGTYCPTRCPEMGAVGVTDAFCDPDTDLCVCDCCFPPSYTDLGGTPASPVIWNEVYTCLDAVGGCESDRTGIELSLIQNDSQIDWSISMGVGEGSMYSGTLCSSEFNWKSLPGTLDETGCWTFSQDQFNKTSLGSTFRCVGAGSRGADSTPATVPTCAELALMDVDYEACPPQP